MQILRCLSCCLLLCAATQIAAQATATASAGSGGAYSVFNAANFGIEGADNSSNACRNGAMGNHDAFGDHITQAFDADLGQNVFEFHSHIDDDSDRCLTFDRIRIEIKGGPSGNSDPELEHNYGNTSYYRWQFRIPEDFVGSSRFCHLFQLKAQGGSDSSFPVLTITARENIVEFSHNAGDDNPSGTRGSLAAAPIDQFRGKWVEIFMEIMHANVGAVSMTAKDVATGNSIMSYSGNTLDLFRGEAGQSIINRPKWGIYRGRNDDTNPPLKDEIVRFANFCSSESDAALCPSILPDTGRPERISNAAPLNGARHVQTYMPISWNAANGADAYKVYFGTRILPPVVDTVIAPGYVPALLEENTTYYYRIGALNASGETLSPVYRFTTLFDADDGTWEVARGHARPERESPQFFAFNTSLSGVGEIDTTALIAGDDGNAAHTFFSTENTSGNHNWRYRPEEDEEVTVVVRLKALPDNSNISYIDYRNAGYRMKCRMNRSTMRFEQAEGTTEEQSTLFNGFWDDEEFHVVRISFAMNPGGGILANAYLDESTTPFATKISTTESGSSYVDVGRAGGDNYGATIDFIAVNPTGGIPPATDGKELPLDLLGMPLSIASGPAQVGHLRISPNPTTGLVRLLDLPLERGGDYRILSADGRLVSSGPLAPRTQNLVVDDLLPGIYFLEVRQAGRRPALTRLVKR